MDKRQAYHITQAFGVEADEADLDFFDANLKFDSLLFVDPFLIKRSPLERERELYQRFDTFFELALDKVLKVKENELARGDVVKFLSFPEPKELYLGYTKESNEGSGLAEDFAKGIYGFLVKEAAKKFILDRTLYPDEKVNLELVILFADKVGPDRISDLCANLIMDYLVKYTQEQCKKWEIPIKILPVGQLFDFEEKEWTDGQHFKLPENPFTRGKPVVFIPKRLLRAPDVTKSSLKSKVTGILRENPNLVERFSRILTKPITEITVEDIRLILQTEDVVLKRVITLLGKDKKFPYDFEEDPLQYLAIKRLSNYFTNKKQPDEPGDCEGLLEHARYLVNTFKDAHERGSLWKDAWESNSKPCKERAWGRTFWAMGIAHFGNYPAITFVPELESGRGAVDFGIIYKNCKITIEIKLLKNHAVAGDPPLKAFIHGVSRQLPKYTINLKAQYAFYVTGQHFSERAGKRPKNHDYRANEIRKLLPKAQEDIKKELPIFEELFYDNIDLSPKSSFSKV